ncbi:dihydroorotase [Alkalihalobacillus alcalophilus ATCC 27647 = CGMCC 1.3604]|uniref:Dihydroorotase n=1 Tax=Alkalihalobacillus alcalophilus ATCC 27647 = CGMCC 1.3604 TaxID=1218173 RepID=A0A094YW83_ALKAL|nr:dihydroorotase [Alkalihalobacillus alcalophilus]KGA97757.1 dihydroorotase [Alkalihalobacillus alcalophilus ATCC 27647 = CGMCC 1.3604]MED1563135.1 dihydroorotase [Alkalihalobacillus alcalophilus]THG89243.1 dihydroorotase [Alkalihalobacillus alcalophilus ATCC 27647 = CGMCC 1.3604]
MKIQLTGGIVLTKDGQEKQIDVSIIDGKISFETLDVYDEKIDVTGKLITPGLVDVHVHLREPGGEQKETIETGTLAAAKGGFTTICAMPNTRPVPDTKEQMEWLTGRIEETGHVNVLPYAAITTRQLGKELTDFDALKEAGAFAFTDDGVGVQSADMMLQAMTKAAELDMAVVAHCEENTLIHAGAVHEGKFSKEHGLNGIPSVCESVHIARDVLLAEAAGAHYHVCHISTKESVRIVRDAKRAGINVTAEVTPHHLLLNEEDIPGLDTNYKMNPPLRGKADQEALIEGLMDGTIDFIATDHAPHTEEEKAQSMERAPFGIVGLETAFPLMYTNFVQTGKMSLKQLVDWLTVLPASTFKLDRGTLQEGAVADIAVIDLELEEKIDKETFVSKGKNTPFQGWSCQGWPVMTFVSGKKVWEKQQGSVVR